MTNEAGLEFERDEETTTINTVKTGDYDVVPSVFHYREKEMPQKLGCAADYDDTCYPCHAKGLWCERAEEMKKKIPTPMTIEMENDTFKNSENIKVSHGNVDCVNVCYAARKAALYMGCSARLWFWLWLFQLTLGPIFNDYARGVLISFGFGDGR